MRVCTFPTLHGERDGGAAVRRHAAVPASRRSRPAGRRVASRCGRCCRRHPARSSFPARPEAARPRPSMPACARLPGRAAARGAWSRSRTRSKWPSTAWPSRRCIRRAAWTWPAGCVFSCGKIRRSSWSAKSATVPTAEAALQASLTGHLLLSTFHAGSAAETVGRLLDMGLEPYVLRSGLLAILNQRLLRRLCRCRSRTTDPAGRLGLDVEHVMTPRGCDDCGGTGYQGRFLLAGNAHALAERTWPARCWPARTRPSSNAWQLKRAW